MQEIFNPQHSLQAASKRQGREGMGVLTFLPSPLSLTQAIPNLDNKSHEERQRPHLNSSPIDELGNWCLKGWTGA